MKNKYKVANHIKTYVRTEIYDLKKNKERIKKLKLTDTTTRTLLLATKRVQDIEEVYDNLPEYEKELAQKIFNDKCNYIYAETHYNITKDQYYNLKNKVIYLTAIKLDLI